MWLCPTQGTYITLESPQRVDICPSEDSQPHNLYQGDCPCKPTVQFHHGRVHMLHIRYTETAAINKSMDQLFAPTLTKTPNDPSK